jgi:hypothetical protein
MRRARTDRNWLPVGFFDAAKPDRKTKDEKRKTHRGQRCEKNEL